MTNENKPSWLMSPEKLKMIFKTIPMDVKSVRRVREGFVIYFRKPHKQLRRVEEISIPLKYSDAEHLYEMLDIHFGPKASRSQQQNSTDIGGPSRDASS